MSGAAELHWLVRLGREHVGKLALGAVTTFALAMAQPYFSSLSALLTLPTSMAEVQAELVRVRDDIEALRRPREIFEVGRSSRPAEGFCIAGEPCEFILILRRTPEGALCSIVPGETIYVFYSADQLLRREVSRIDAPSPRNLGTDWSELRVTVRTPSDFPAASGFAIVPLYSHCGGPEDRGQVRQESVLVPVTILAERPAP